MKQIKKQAPFMVRQGDVLLERVEAIPAKATKKPLDKGRIVLAYGEVTGHAHTVVTADRGRVLDTRGHLAISDAEVVDAFLAELDGETYLSAPNGASVVHEEHAAITLPPGRYRVVRQREYRPAGIVNVSD